MRVITLCTDDPVRHRYLPLSSPGGPSAPQLAGFSVRIVVDSSSQTHSSLPEGAGTDETETGQKAEGAD